MAGAPFGVGLDAEIARAWGESTNRNVVEARYGPKLAWAWVKTANRNVVLA